MEEVSKKVIFEEFLSTQFDLLFEKFSSCHSNHLSERLKSVFAKEAISIVKSIFSRVSEESDEVLSGNFTCFDGVELPLFAILEIVYLMIQDLKMNFSNNEMHHFIVLIEKSRGLSSMPNYHVHPLFCQFLPNCTSIYPFGVENKIKGQDQSFVSTLDTYAAIYGEEGYQFPISLEDLEKCPDLACDPVWFINVCDPMDEDSPDRSFFLFKEQEEEIGAKFDKAFTFLAKQKICDHILPYFKKGSLDDFALSSKFYMEEEEYDEIVYTCLESFYEKYLAFQMNSKQSQEEILNEKQFLYEVYPLVKTILDIEKTIKEDIIFEIVEVYFSEVSSFAKKFIFLNLGREEVKEKLAAFSLEELYKIFREVRKRYVFPQAYLSRVIK